MVLMFFKGQGLVSQNKSMIVIFSILWGSIAWPIEQTWLWKIFQQFAFSDPPWAFVANLAQLLCTFIKKTSKIYKVGYDVGNNGNKILWNMKTRRISMLSLAKRLKAKYKTFSVKMVLDNHTNQQVKQNYEQLCDLQILLGFAYILPLLKSMHALIEFA